MAVDNIFSGLWARKVLELIKAGNTGTTLACPGTLYLALLSGDKDTIATSDDTTSLTAFTGFSQSTLPTIAFGDVSTDGTNTARQQMSNTGNDIEFTITSVTEVTIGGIAIVKNSAKVASYNTSYASNGDVIWFGSTASNIKVITGNILTFKAGQITIRLG